MLGGKGREGETEEGEDVRQMEGGDSAGRERERGREEERDRRKRKVCV